MIRLRIKSLMKEKGVKAPFKKMVALGISHSIAHDYMSGKKKWILIEHVETLCLLLHCRPNDLFEWLPDDTMQDDPRHPLQQLKPKAPFVLDEAIKNLSPDEIRKLFEKGNEEKKE